MGCVNQGQRAAGKGGLGSLQGRGPRTTALRADEGEKGVPQGPSKAYPGHLDPVLHHPGPVPGRHSPVPQAGGDDAVGHTVELGDRGADSGSQVFLALLVPLGPDGAQAVVGHHLLEQLLGDHGEHHLAPPRPSSASRVSLVPAGSPVRAGAQGKLRMWLEPRRPGVGAVPLGSVLHRPWAPSARATQMTHGQRRASGIFRRPPSLTASTRSWLTAAPTRRHLRLPHRGSGPPALSRCTLTAGAPPPGFVCRKLQDTAGAS